MANMGADTGTTGTQRVSNRSILVLCLVFFFAMIGMAYAAVPLYTLFCRVTDITAPRNGWSNIPTLFSTRRSM